MKSALLIKAALCVCPPALMVTAVTAVPSAKRAVHHVTRPHTATAPKVGKAHAGVTQVAALPCPPAPGVALPLLNFAYVGPDEVATPSGVGAPIGAVAQQPNATLFPVSTLPSVGGGVIVPPTGPVQPGVPTAPVVPTAPEPPVVGAVPEPTTWAIMIAGFGAVGVALRMRARRLRTDPTVWTGKRRKRRSRPVRALAMRASAMLGLFGASLVKGQGATVAAAVGAKSAKTAALSKLAMCVCPPALLALGTATIPPVRQAVYAATAPAQVAAPAPPCLPVAEPVLLPSVPVGDPALLPPTGVDTTHMD